MADKEIWWLIFFTHHAIWIPHPLVPPLQTEYPWEVLIILFGEGEVFFKRGLRPSLQATLLWVEGGGLIWETGNMPESGRVGIDKLKGGWCWW